MDVESLLGEVGRAALAHAAEMSPTEASFLACFEKLRKQYPAPLARSALETALLRRRAAAKFEFASRMYFTREALEIA